MKLSIIIPVYNEEKTIEKVVKLVNDIVLPYNFRKEIIVVDDGSTDATASVISNFQLQITNFKFIKHKKNLGKGSAVRTGIKNATGDYIIIQDADLEYNPSDIPTLLGVAVKNKGVVVYGTRLKRLPNLTRDERTPQFLLHYFGNKFLNLITNILYGGGITDMETGYKLFPKKALENIEIHAQGFDFEPEVTAKLLKRRNKITEVPIITNPRGYGEGKKLHTVRDGFKALWTLLKFRFVT